MRVVGAQKAYGSTTVLSVDSAEFERGACTAIIGSNGSGKTTLLRALARQVKLDSGTIEVESGERVGYMPQRSYAFYGTTEKNIRLGLNRAEQVDSASADVASFDAVAARESAGDAAATAFPDLLRLWKLPSEQRIRALMEVLSIDNLAASNAKRLSGGETARMALARLLVGKYDYLLLDEPTAALDVTSTLVSERLLRTYLQSFDAGIVIVTHSIKQAERLSDEVLFMDNGRIIERGATARVLANPQTDELRRFLEVAGS